jgi:hypothetical protein
MNQQVRVLPNMQARYLSQDILVTSIASQSLNNRSETIYVEPAAKILLSPAALEVLKKLRSW